MLTIDANFKRSTTVAHHIFMLSEFVQGKTLRDMIDCKELDLGFVIGVVCDLLDFLRELRDQQIQHGDLHAKNIIIEDRSSSLVGPPFRVRVLDFGVAQATGQRQLLDDFDQLALMLREMLDTLELNSLSPTDRTLADFLRKVFLGKMLHEDNRALEARARDPKGLYDAIQSAKKDAVLHVATVAKRELATPFDYLSCEQIGEAHLLLKDLYSDKMLGLPSIEDHNNLVLTGPRGCGKTTVFRCLSLKHRIRTDDDRPDGVKYVGIYYRCDDLYYAFPRYQKPLRKEALDLPIHFLTVTLFREFLEVSSAWLSRHDPEGLRESEAVATRAIWTELGVPIPQSPDGLTLASVARALEKQRHRAAAKQSFANDPKTSFGTYFGPDKLLALCERLRERFSLLQERPTFFLVDDYSSPKISRDLQTNLNRLLMQRSPAAFFKLATESPASFESSDVDGKTYVESREFKLVNLGVDFIHANLDDKRRFVDDVFNKRLSFAPSFKIKTLQALVGDDIAFAGHNQHAKSIRAGKRTDIWGRSALAELCSGDVHYLIDLVGKMVTAQQLAPLPSGEYAVPAIASGTQNRAIREYAKNFLTNLRSHPRGQALVEVVEAFGSVASSYLKYKDSKNEEAQPPHQASRIEPLEDPKLQGDALEIYNDLLRYSVFLQEIGKSRRGLIVPRLYLRRFLVPFFNLTFSRRDSIELSVDDLNTFLLNPKDFEKTRRLRGVGEVDANGQLALLPGGADGKDQ